MTVNYSNLNLQSWNEPGDYFSYSELDNNWSNIDVHDHTGSGKGVQIPSNGIQDNAISSNKIADNAVEESKLADNAVSARVLADNVLPLGTVIDWWRPNTGVSVPDGWAICDGSNWADIDNDFGLGSGNIPDLVGKVIMGARLTVNSDGTGGFADGLSSSNGNSWPNAPGIGGSGGSNQSLNLTHTHSATVPAHKHYPNLTIALPGINPAGAHNHGGETEETEDFHDHNITTRLYTDIKDGGNVSIRGLVTDNFTLFSTEVGAEAHTHGITAASNHTHTYNGSATVGGYVGSTDPAAINGDNSFTLTTVNGLATPVDARLAHVGMLKIMKVKNT